MVGGIGFMSGAFGIREDDGFGDSFRSLKSLRIIRLPDTNYSQALKRTLPMFFRMTVLVLPESELRSNAVSQ